MTTSECCASPWMRLYYGTGQYFSCCWAEQRSYTHSQWRPAKPEDELWNTWNSVVMVAARSVMASQGQTVACKDVTRDGERGPCPFFIYGVGTDAQGLTELQRANMIAAQESFRLGETVVRHYPLDLALCLDYVCNLRCAHCWQTDDRSHPWWGREGIDVERNASQIVEFCRRALVVELVGGEPTVSPRYERVLNLIREANGAKIRMTTNGLTLREKILPLKDMLSVVNISVDGATKAAYESLRGQDTWERFRSNLEAIVDSGIRHGYTMTVTSANLSDMAAVAELAHHTGATYITYNAECGGGESPWMDKKQHSLRAPGVAEPLQANLSMAKDACRQFNIQASFYF